LSFYHEFRNPLNSLLGNLQLTLLNDLPEGVREKINTAKVCGELLLSLINKILDKGKVEVQDLEFNPTPTRIIESLEKVWGVCLELIKERGLNGCLNIDKRLPHVIKID